jgi:uncharacterized RDD family membrane protein YckC
MTDGSGSEPSDVGPAGRPDVHWQPPRPEVGPAPGVEFAPRGARLVAYLLDGLLLWLLVALFWAPIFAVAPARATDGTPEGDPLVLVIGVVFGIVGVLVAFLYFPFFWAGSGRTPGMRPFRLYVVRDIDGSTFGWGTALLRLLGLYVAASLFYLGFLWVFVDARRRGWHDLIAGTVVIKRS